MRKTAMITGSTSGIGLAAAKGLAKKGFDIIGVGRSKEKCIIAENEIKAQNAKANVKFFVGDLSLQSDIRRMCGEIGEYLKQNYDSRLDCLVNNAGVFTTYYTLTDEGFEMQFAVNHLAHFLITALMMPMLKKSDSPKVLTTSSGSHYGAIIDFDNIMLSRKYNQLRAYKRTKLMNVLFTCELNKRYGEIDNFAAYAVDPALVNTAMGNKNTFGLAKIIWSIRRRHGVSPEAAAKTIVYLAQDSAPGVSSGFYYKNCRVKSPNKRGVDEKNAVRLWEISSKYCEA